MAGRQGLPLDGVRVIEFTHMVMGPAAGLILADLGADEVIDRLTTDFTRLGRRWDAIIDSVGKLSFWRCRGSLVARGSMAYSAVTQPWPVPRRQEGTPGSTLAVQWTSVPPARTRQDPSA